RTGVEDVLDARECRRRGQRNAEEEGEAGGVLPPQTAEETGRQGGAGARNAGHQRQRLGGADDDRVAHGDRLEASAVCGDTVGPPEEETEPSQEDGDDGDREGPVRLGVEEVVDLPLKG